jgi:hypothetical protein
MVDMLAKLLILAPTSPIDICPLGSEKFTGSAWAYRYLLSVSGMEG